MTAIVCFHNPDEENGYLSNWYPSPFALDGASFSSAEQYMMYRKATCFGDETIAERILEAKDPALIKALGRQVAGYDDRVWCGLRQLAVYEGLLAKFSQNPVLGEKLLLTGDALLAECAVKDRVWGIGLSMGDLARLDPSRWQGQNLLGYTLMAARERLRSNRSEFNSAGDGLANVSDGVASAVPTNLK